MKAKGKTGAVLVVGGGISGMQSSLDLADSGFKVYLVENKPTIGGAMAQLDKTFPTNDCSMCIMAPKLVAADKHPNIEIISNAVVDRVTGMPGRFMISLVKHPRFVDEEKCTGCGVCSTKCPVEAIDMYNEGLMARAAIYVDYPQAVPLKFAIDRDRCIGCGICEGECQAKAINFDQPEELMRLKVGSIILSPGFDEFDPTPLAEYGYGKYPNVVSSIEFERMLSASGPFRGIVMRPSDGKVPERVAFIQCVGSRTDHYGHNYCSSVCCMHAIKEAMIAQEHTQGLSSHIFFMDIRAFGKEFDDYVTRAEEEFGIGITRANRVADITQVPGSRDLDVRYIEEGGIRTERFNLVVLSVGLHAPRTAEDISRVFGIKLNQYNFADTGTFAPLETSAPGIYVSGAFSGPKDIPTTVAEASGAASKAAGDIHEARNTMLTPVELPPERDVTGEEPRVGVFVCHCGINIGGVVDVPDVVEYAKSLPGVVYAENNLYTCSADTQERIKEKIEGFDLNRVVVASCTPRTHEPLFRNTVREAGLNPYLFEMANIRDQCSWVHMHEPEAATFKARDLVRMAVSRACLLEPLQRAIIPVTQRALVIGGGISGMTAALDIADQGFTTYLIEHGNDLGGIARSLHTTLRGDDVQIELEQVISRVWSHPNIQVYVNSEIETIEGSVGNFSTKLRGNEETLEHGVILVTTGGVEYKPEEYLYGKTDRVVTQLEFEDELAKAKAKDLPRTAVFIQCVGCRNAERPYCSRVCCGTSVKQALILKKKHPDAQVFVLYRDLRTYSFKEDAYRDAAERGVIFIRYREGSEPVVSKGKKGDSPLVVDVYEELLQELIRIEADRLILAAAILPQEENERLAQLLKLPLSKDRFFLEAHMKLRPLDFSTDGVFLAGLAHSPKYMDECIAQASGAAARALCILSRPTFEAEGIVAAVETDLCRGCGRCREACVYCAIDIEEVEPEVFISRVNEALCKGCGTCAVTCPSKAITMRHFTEDQILATMRSLLLEATSDGHV
jgi:heterodisulfide reductase subunit A